MPGGRPPFEITEDVCKKAETLAAQGLTMDQIAAVLGVGVRTVYEKQAQYPQFSQAISDGKAKGIATITNALFQNAKSGDTQAQKYYLNNRDNANWKDRIHNNTDLTTGGEKIQNNYNIHPTSNG
jgi:hypothetical protein